MTAHSSMEWMISFKFPQIARENLKIDCHAADDVSRLRRIEWNATRENQPKMLPDDRSWLCLQPDDLLHWRDHSTHHSTSFIHCNMIWMLYIPLNRLNDSKIADKSAHCWHATATGQLIQRRSGQWRSGRIGENEAKDDSNRLGSLNKWKTGNRFLGFPAKKREDCLWFDDGLGLLFGCCHVVVVVEVGSRTVQRPIIEKLPKTTSQQNRRRNHQHNCQCVPLILLGRAPQLEFRWNGHSRIRRPESSDCVNCMCQAEDSEPVSHITWLAHK